MYCNPAYIIRQKLRLKPEFAGVFLSKAARESVHGGLVQTRVVPQFWSRSGGNSSLWPALWLVGCFSRGPPGHLAERGRQWGVQRPLSSSQQPWLSGIGSDFQRLTPLWRKCPARACTVSRSPCLASKLLGHPGVGGTLRGRPVEIEHYRVCAHFWGGALKPEFTSRRVLA